MQLCSICKFFLSYVNQELPVQVFEKQLTGNCFSVIFLKIYLYWLMKWFSPSEREIITLKLYTACFILSLVSIIKLF